MNERIKELAEQAGGTVHKAMHGEAVSFLENDLERFAELVRQDEREPQECCGDYEKCWKACTPRGRWLAEKELRKEWVGLTDEELSETYNDLYTQYTRDNVNIADFILIARTIEAQLKEKNT